MTAHVLNLSPLVTALEFQPYNFTRLPNGDIRHIGSNHDIHFKPWWQGAGVTVQTMREHRCDCVDRVVMKRVGLVMTRAQRAELKSAARAWVRNYWEPKMAAEAARINRDFASHYEIKQPVREPMPAFKGALADPLPAE